MTKHQRAYYTGLMDEIDDKKAELAEKEVVVKALLESENKTPDENFKLAMLCEEVSTLCAILDRLHKQLEKNKLSKKEHMKSVETAKGSVKINSKGEVIKR